MSDLIKRLRALSAHQHDDLSIGDEAADEIETLRAALGDLTAKFEKELSISGKYIRKPIYDTFEASLRRARAALQPST